MAKNEFSPYAPIRLREQLWWKYALLAAKDGHVAADGRISGDLPDMIMEYLVKLYVSAFRKAVHDQPNAGLLMGTHTAKVLLFRDWVPLAAQYELCGRQIFDFHDDLVTMLGNTDLGECSLEGWNRPYDAFFLRFGRQADMKLPFEGDEYEYLDGAFVACTPVSNNADEFRLKIGFSTAHEDGTGVMLPGYFIDFTPDEQRMLLPDAINTSLARRMSVIADQPSDPESVRAVNSHLRAELEDSVSLLRAGVTLLVNALFYLDSIGDHKPDAAPGRDTPPTISIRWAQSNDKQRIKQRSSLTASGYALVRLVGQELKHSNSAAPSRSDVRAHWRRGHWRWQRHGEALVFKKRIWIKPIMVGAEYVNTDGLPGHIYMTGASDNLQ